MLRPICCLLVVMACGKGKGAETDDDVEAGPPPDVTGSYNVIAHSATGCSGQSYFIEDWVPGLLTIDSSGGNLDLEFDYAGMVFEGVVDGTNNYVFDGLVEDAQFSVPNLGLVTATLDVLNEGTFTEGSNGCWTMEGDFTIEVDEDDVDYTNCEITGYAEASQLSGGECVALDI